MDPRLRVTHRDIAARTGYDRSTVSLALKGDPRIAAETRRIIEATAAELGYRPDPTIAALARQRWMRSETLSGAAIAYLVERRKGDYQLQHRHFADAREHANRRGYVLEEFDLSDYPSGAAASRALHSRGIRGLLLPSLPNDVDRAIQDFAWQQFTVVCCSVGWLRTPFHAVTADMFEGTRRAWRELAARGYRRIGAALYRHTPVAIDDHTRLGASYSEQIELDSSHARLPFLLCGPDDKPAFLRWFKKHRPDAVIGLTPREASWIRETGASIPDDVAYVSLHAFDFLPVAGLFVERDSVARTALDLLITEMRENQWAVPAVQQVVHVRPRWIEGNTVRQVPWPTPETGLDDWPRSLRSEAAQASR